MIEALQCSVYLRQWTSSQQKWQWAVSARCLI